MVKTDYKDNEDEGVEELRRRLKDLLSPKLYADTNMFIRFLRARNHDIQASENMLRKHLNWREVRKIDTILQWYTPHEVEEEYTPYSKLGFDREGHPVSYWAFGNADLNGIFKLYNKTRTANFICKLLEEAVVSMEQQSKKLNKNIDQWVHILDFNNLSLATVTNKHVLETFASIFILYEENYPERMKLVHILNASWYFQIAFAFLKPLITGRTLQKIKIHGKFGWQEELRNLMDIDELPAFLGGNKTDPNGDPLCSSYINHGKPIPEHLYERNQKISLISQPDVKRLSINRLSKVQVELHVLHAGSEIEWEFETKNKDIAFTLLYKESKFSSSEPEELLPKQRIDTSFNIERGVIRSEKAGTYYLEFDNTYSWMHNKEVYYKISVTTPCVMEN